MISPTQIPLPDNTQHSQQTDIHAPGQRAKEQLQTHALDLAAPEFGPSGLSDVKIAFLFT